MAKRSNYLYFLILIVLAQASSDDQPQISCQHNATIDQSSKTCVCPQGYIGNQCQMPAYQLNQQLIPVTLSDKFIFAYFLPKQPAFERLAIQICLPDTSSETVVHMYIFEQQQTSEGNFMKEPISYERNNQFSITASQKCLVLRTKNAIAVGQKLNGERLKVIFGFKLIGNAGQTTIVDIACFEEYIFTLNFIRDLGVIFIVFTTLAVCSSAIFNIRQKLLERRQARIREQKYNQLVTGIMPSIKFQQYLQQKNLTGFTECCTICLSQFQPSEKIRQTPCKHLFHQECLDCWCKKQMSCPICRFSFIEAKNEGQTEVNGNIEIQLHENELQNVDQIVEEISEMHEQNIRERML